MAEPSSPQPPPVPVRQSLHVVFVVDTSGSMSGERIGSLNWAARAAIPAMRDVAMEHPDVEVLVRVCRFGDDVTWPVAAPTPVEGFVWATLSAAGESRMGAALTEVATALPAGAGEGSPSLPPVIVLLSDGMPSDDAEAGIAALDAAPLSAGAIRIPIAIGSDADLDVLRHFAGRTDLPPLRANNAETLVKRMCWAATTPVDIASAPPDGAPPPSVPPPTDPPPGGTTGPDLW